MYSTPQGKQRRRRRGSIASATHGGSASERGRGARGTRGSGSASQSSTNNSPALASETPSLRSSTHYSQRLGPALPPPLLLQTTSSPLITAQSGHVAFLTLRYRPRRALRAVDVIDSGVDVDTPNTGLLSSITTDPMAPPVRDMSNVADALKDVIQNLFDMQSQVHDYQPETQDLLVEKIIDLTTSLSHLRNLSHSQADLLPSIPPELVDYIDEGRNPDIYTREIVELVQRGNAVVLGKMEAFVGFSQIFAKALVDHSIGDGVAPRGMARERDRIATKKAVDRIMTNAGLTEENQTTGNNNASNSSQHGGGRMGTSGDGMATTNNR